MQYCYLSQVFEDGLDPDSLFDRLKEGSISEKKNIVKPSKPRKVRFISLIVINN